jgi:membrane-associated phospholipid phosphatase
VFERRLVSRRLRPVVVATSVVAAAGVTVLGLAYTGTSSAGRIDGAFDRWLIAHLGTHVTLVRALADVGNPVPIVLATLVLAAVLLRLGRARAVVLTVTAPVVATLLTELVGKPLVDRTHAGGASFPSGHATATCAVLLVLVVVVLDQRPPRLPTWLQVAVCLAAVALAGMVCAALAAAQYHYVSDTLGGAGVAVASVLTLALIIDTVAELIRPGRRGADGPRPAPPGSATAPS